MIKGKRLDIQGIRGVAIASVLAFHLKPELFPTGFVGVDIFFVLSGYLMSSILARERSINVKVLIGFYTRRFKRIVPLYALLLLVLLFVVPPLLLRSVEKFVSDSIWAAAFATNIHSVVEKTDYFAELYDSNVLTHTWSLGVEIQYYVIVPLLISIQRLLGKQIHLPYLAALATGSFTVQCWTSPNVSFNALQSRVWQFLVGGVAHELIARLSEQTSAVEVPIHKANKVHATPSSEIFLLDNEEKENLKSENQFRLNAMSRIFAMILMILSLSPLKFVTDQTLRAVVVALTAAVIVLGKDEQGQSTILRNRAMVYLGDVSYVVYLVHWPVFTLWKSYWDLFEMRFCDVVFCLVITFLLSIFVHETIEQMFITAPTGISTILVGSVYIIMFFAIALKLPVYLSVVNYTKSSADPLVSAAITWNEYESHKWGWNDRPFEDCADDPEGIVLRDGHTDQPSFECLWTSKNASGDVSVLIVGNSIAHAASKILHSILVDNIHVKEVRLFAHSGCQPIEPLYSTWCREHFVAQRKLVERMKPDITFLIYDDSKRLREPIANNSTDKTLADYIDFLKPLGQNSKYLVLDEFYPLPRTTAGVAISMYKRLLRNQSLDSLKDRYDSFLTSYYHYFRRLDKLPASIPNIIRHNTSADLCADQAGWCSWYNKRNSHAYFSDNKHLTVEGLELMRNSYTKILEQLIKKSEQGKDRSKYSR